MNTRFSTKKHSMLFAALISVLAPVTTHATIMDVGNQIGTTSNVTRGFWFTAPTDFTITGVGVATTASTANFDVAVMLLNSTPPTFNATTNAFTTLFMAKNVAGSALVSTLIDVHAGDIIGVLGSRGANAINSYAPGNYVTNILGNSVTLQRLGMQFNLHNVDPQNIWTENGNISRVLLDIEAPQSNPIPEPSTLALLGLGGLLSLAVSRKRNA
jgi:hypothetical protein